MLCVTLEENTFDPSVHPSIKEYIDQIRAGSDLLEAAVCFDKRVVKYLQEQKYLNGFVSEEDLGETVSMKFLTTSLTYFGRWLLMYTDSVRIVSPPELKTIMKELSEKLLACHRDC